MYLARSIRWNGRAAQMVGAIPGDVVMRERPVGRGYVRLAETADHLWPLGSMAAPSQPRILGHEFHHSELVDADPGLRYAYAVQRGHGVDGVRDGVIVDNLLASYCHLRGSGGNDWPRRFVAFVRQVAERRCSVGSRAPGPHASPSTFPPLEGAHACSV
jgi:cobyrinic acid a,c-diamide synthase